MGLERGKTMKESDTKDLTQLGSADTKYIYDKVSPELLETFDNPKPYREYTTTFEFYEFSSLCPKTGQPDFGIITVSYIADKKCIETKSLKLYFLSYRQTGSFMEAITNQILDDLVAAISPKHMKVIGDFNTRGGTDIIIKTEYDCPSANIKHTRGSMVFSDRCGNMVFSDE